MTLRSRMLLAFGAVVLIPLVLLAFGLRHEMTNRLSSEYQARVETAVAIIREDFDRQSASISERLASLKTELMKDNSFRLAAVGGVESERGYLLDYADTAMRLTGLSMLQILDDEDRIISSGHFRNEHGRLMPGLAAVLKYPGEGVVLLPTRAADGEFLSLVRGESFRIAGRSFTIVGGVVVDQSFLRRLARDRDLVVSLESPGRALSSDPARQESGALAQQTGPADAAVASFEIPVIQMAAGTPPEVVQASLQVTQERTPLRTLLRSVDSLFIMTAAVAAVAALLLASWLSSRISRPLAALAAKTAVLDLDRLNVRFEGGADEVGTLSRVLNDLASRLRSSTARVREAERRATIGDLARQVNHDIKNGLIPLRNVIRHLQQVEREDPSTLHSVFGERRNTMDSSIAYLETLATSYQRLSTGSELRDCDLNALISEVVRATQGRDTVEFVTHLKRDLPTVVGDPIAFRRILENLTTNAVDSLESRPGRVTVSTEVISRDGDAPLVRVTVADTGRGMSKDEAGKIFNDFYTTKEGGTGLGLSIVRRLVMDAHGTIAVESEPGKGTRMMIEISSRSFAPILAGRVFSVGLALKPATGFSQRISIPMSCLLWKTSNARGTSSVWRVISLSSGRGISSR